MAHVSFPKVDRQAQAAASHSPWLQDCWYVIAWEHEIPAADSAELFHRTVLGEPILVMRTNDGLVALEDRCVHRLAPLSKGRREGDDVRCGYHGLKFNSCGVCIEAPGITKVPDRARVKAYPVVVTNNRSHARSERGVPSGGSARVAPHPRCAAVTVLQPISTVGSSTTSCCRERC